MGMKISPQYHTLSRWIIYFHQQYLALGGYHVGSPLTEDVLQRQGIQCTDYASSPLSN